MLPKPELILWGVPSDSPCMDYICKMTLDQKKKAVITLETGEVCTGFFECEGDPVDLDDGRKDVPYFCLLQENGTRIGIPEAMITDIEIVNASGILRYNSPWDSRRRRMPGKPF